MASAENRESSCIPVNDFPHEVIFHNIMPRLPAKSLARFKCVSKLWLQSISDPKLAKSHLVFQTPGCINIFQGSILHFADSADDDTQSYKLNLFDILGEPQLIPIKSCNGLLVVAQQPSGYCKVFRRTVKHYIVNPVTRRHINLPPAINHVERCVGSFTDCFMHYDSGSNEYKVLGWYADVSLNPDPVYVLVLSDRLLQNEISWRAFRQPRDFFMMRYQPALFNGWYHWIVLHRKIRGQWAILALNIEIGEFKVMKVPETAGMIPSWSYRLVTVNESLYLIQRHSPGMNDYCYVLWELKDYEQQIWSEVGQYRVEYCQRCKESGGDSSSTASTTPIDATEIIKDDDDFVHTNSLVWLDTRL